MGFVYKTTNLIDGKIYIGKYSGKDKKYLGSGTYLKNAINKYGRENFIREIIEDGISDDKILCQREIYWIDFYKSRDPNIGYNLTIGGDGNANPSEETRKKMGDSRRGKKHSQESIDKTTAFHRGSKRSEESRKRMSDAQKALNRVMPQEQRDKISKANKGRVGPMAGKKQSAESNAKRSKTEKGRVSNRKGAKLSDEVKKKLSIAFSGEKNPMFGKKMSKENIDKARVGRRRTKVKRPLIFSCSMFFNELDLLEIKMSTLGNMVDYFVISESDTTHSSIKKPFYFEENKDKFRNFKSKIIHQMITDTPSKYDDFIEDESKGELYNLVIKKVVSQEHRHLKLEHYFRDCFEKESLIRALKFAKDDDIILLSDLDEIVTSDALKSVLDNFDPEQIYFFQHNTYYYYLNLKSDEISYGTIALTYKKFKEMSHSAMREDKPGLKIPSAGYHFTYLGNAEAVKNKVESFSHQEFNVPQVKDHIEWSIRNAIATGRDLYGRPRQFQVVGIETLPKYVQDNLEKFDKYIYKEN